MDKKALRNERVQFTSKGAPGSTPILGAGQIPGSTNLVVVNQQTRGQARFKIWFNFVKTYTRIVIKKQIKIETESASDRNSNMAFLRSDFLKQRILFRQR